MTSTRAALYLRISRDFTGDRLGVERQRADCERLAKQRGWQVVETHTDNDVSAAGGRRRNGFEAMLTALENGSYDVIVAWNLDRLTRNRNDTVRLIEIGQRTRATIALVQGSDLDMSTPAGRMTAEILGSVARNEIEVKAERQRAANAQRAEQGKPNLGVRLLGYETDGTTRPGEAEVVREIFARFAAGDSLRGIASDLTAREVPTRHGGRWNPSTIRGVLTNPRYAGLVKYQGEITGHQGNWEPLVTEDMWRAIQTTLSDPRRKRHQGTDRKHLGSGLYVCDQCSRSVVSLSRTSTNDGPVNRYYCRTCRMSRTSSHIDRFVTDTVSAILQRDVEDLTHHLTPADTADATSERAGEIRARITRIEADYDAGFLDGRRYASAIERAQAELDQLFAETARTTGSTALADALSATDPAEYFRTTTLMIRRQIIGALVEVRLKKHRQGQRGFDPATVAIKSRL